MRGRLLNLLTTLSLLLCAATLALWVRSYRVQDILSIKNGERMTNLSSVAGSFYFVRHASPVPLPRGVSLHAFDRGPNRTDAASKLARFEFGDDRSEGIVRFVMFPQWTVVVLCAVLPAVGLVRRRRRILRQRQGCCPGCGYDLSSTSGRCPECGTVTSVSVPTAP